MGPPKRSVLVRLAEIQVDEAVSSIGWRPGMGNLSEAYRRAFPDRVLSCVGDDRCLVGFFEMRYEQGE